MAGCQGAQPGPCSAPWWPPCPQREGRQRGWLRARAVPGAGTNRHRLTGESLAVAAQPGGLSPRSAGGLSTGTKFQPCGRSNGQESNLLQTSCEVALPISYQRWQAGSRTRDLLLRGVTGALPIPSTCGVRHARNRQSPETPDSWHRWGELLFKPRPVSGHRLRWMSSLLPDACQLLMDECVFCKLLI